MRTRAKGHARVNFNNVLAVFCSILLPAWLDNQAFAHVRHMKILLPFVSPILLAHLAKARVAKAVLANAFLNQCQLRIYLCQALRKLVIVSIIGTDGDHLGILLLGNITQLPGAAISQIVNQLRVLNGHTLRACVRQNISDCLHRLVRHSHIYFYPLHFSALL